MKGSALMKDLRQIIAKNIAELRSEARITQIKLAEALNYSDKAVSKWERGEAIPDVTVLKSIADYFGVTVDYLLESEHRGETVQTRALLRMKRRNRIFITAISVLLVWLCATVAFAVLYSLGIPFRSWLVYIYAVPVSLTLLLVLNCVWGRRRLNYLIVTFLMWSLILSVYLTLIEYNMWLLFVVGAPAQVILCFVPGIRFIRYNRHGGDNT
ncbi:MAG: helix-turn-helix transcriptional regulator [Clostridia bacterium]|nr:helix-turn-helix transcriptional regulator [Clostridia bacterium]